MAEVVARLAGAQLPRTPLGVKGMRGGQLAYGKAGEMPSLDLDFANQRYLMGGVGITPAVADTLTFTRSTGGGRFNAQGQYEWLGPDEPRIDYDPVTGKCLGLLVEEQRTNLLPYSSDFTDESWREFRTNVTLGASGMWHLRESAESGVHYLQAPYQLVPQGQSDSRSLTVAPGDRSRVALAMTGNNQPTSYATFDLVTGEVVEEAPGITASIQPVGGGAFRISASGVQMEESRPFAIYLIPDGGRFENRSYQGDGESGIYIRDAQLEAGSFPTSYIPTEGAQVTRASDIAVVNELSPWYNSEQGTLFVEAAAVPHVIGGPRGLMAIEKRTDYHATRSFYSLLGVDGVCDFAQAGAYINPPFAPLPAGSTVKAAVAASVAGGSVAQNGQVTSPSLRMSSFALDRMWIGASPGGALKAGMHIRSVRYFPRRLSAPELQEMTK